MVPFLGAQTERTAKTERTAEVINACSQAGQASEAASWLSKMVSWAYNPMNVLNKTQKKKNNELTNKTF